MPLVDVDAHVREFEQRGFTTIPGALVGEELEAMRRADDETASAVIVTCALPPFCAACAYAKAKYKPCAPGCGSNPRLAVDWQTSP